MSIELALSSPDANFDSRLNLFLLETFQMYLMMSLLYEKVLKTLSKISTFLTFYQQINKRQYCSDSAQVAIQHWFCNLRQCSAIVVVKYYTGSEHNLRYC